MELKRNIYQKLLEWKKQNTGQVLELQGARQVGKTYILKKFGRENFEKMVYINKQDKFSSYDDRYKDKQYKSYRLRPNSAQIKDMEIICLKNVLTEIIGATIG